MKINDYLAKIESGESINLKAFVEKLNLKDPIAWSSIYSAKRTDNGHVLSINDAKAHSLFYQNDISSRIEGAKQGKSHSIGTSFANMLLINTTCSPNTPHVIVSTGYGVISSTPKLNKTAVIIENIENFYLYSTYMECIGHQSLITVSDFIFGAGTQINNSLNLSFLSKYEQIYVAGDLDLGGLKIYKTLVQNIPGCRWLSPVDWGKFSAFFNMKPKSVSDWQQAISIADELKLEEEAQLLRHHKAFLEQEALLL